MREQNFWGDKSIKSGRKISLCLLRSVVGRDDDSRWPNQHAASLVFSLEREAIRPVLQPFFLRPFRVEVVQKDSLVSNIVLLKPIPPPSKDNICNFFFYQNQKRSQTGLVLTWRVGEPLSCKRQRIRSSLSISPQFFSDLHHKGILYLLHNEMIFDVISLQPETFKFSDFVFITFGAHVVTQLLKVVQLVLPATDSTF